MISKKTFVETSLSFALALFMLTDVASGSTINDTGANGTGGLISLGSVDSDFLLFPSTCCGAGLPVNAFPSNFLSGGAYSGAHALSNSATAEWIGYTGLGQFWANGSTATATFQETFTLTSADIAAGNLSISGLLGLTGDYQDISLNGHADTTDAFAVDYGAALHSFDVTTGFQAGTNTLDFVESWTIADGTAHGNSSTAIIVDDLELSGGAAPEPGTLVLFGTAIVLISLHRRIAARLR